MAKPKYDELRCNRGFRSSGKDKLILTNYNNNYTDNGNIATGTYYPYDESSFACSDWFRYKDDCINSNNTNFYMGTGNPDSYICRPSSSGYYTDVIKLLGQNMVYTAIGNEMVYELYYDSYYVDSGNIFRQPMSLIIHTMQSFDPYYPDIHLAVQGAQHCLNYYDGTNLNMPLTNTSNLLDIKQLPKRHICITKYEYISSDCNLGYESYTYSAYDARSTNIYNVGLIGNNDTYEKVPALVWKNTIEYFATYKQIYENLRTDLRNLPYIYYMSSATPIKQQYRKFNIHNVKYKKLNDNVSYYYTDKDIELNTGYINSDNTDYTVHKFQTKILPTASAYYSNSNDPNCPAGAATLRTSDGVRKCFDLCEFLKSYSEFLKSGSIIYPAYKLYGKGFAYEFQTFLPTIRPNSLADTITDADYNNYRYVPIDTAKCMELLNVINNICSTASNEVLLVPLKEATDSKSYYSGYDAPDDTNYPKKDVTINRTSTQQSPVRYF